MKTITLQLPNELYETFQAMANAHASTTEEQVVEWLARHAPNGEPQWSPEQLLTARLRFERHFGAWDSGDSRAADNERIDADLAREYGMTHEEA